MRKLFAILLCIVTMLSMVACGGNQNHNETPNVTQNTIQEDENTDMAPTAEEWTAIDEYHIIMNTLQEYAETGNIWIAYSDFGVKSDVEGISGMEALAFCYERLTKLELVDKWVGTDYMDETWVRRDVLDSFVIIEDVLLSEKRIYEDHLGNRDDAVAPSVWTYNTDGTVDSTTALYYFDPNNEHPWMCRSFLQQVDCNPGGVNVGTPFFMYGADGKVETVEYAYFAGDTVNAARKLAYTGNLISGEQIIFADGTEQSVFYTYNDTNQITEITTVWGLIRNRLRYTFTYTYNDCGQVAMEKVLVEQEDYWNENTYVFYREAVTNYTYDSNGNLSGGVCVCTENWDNGKATTTDTWAYSCDDQGRPVAVNISCGDTIKESADVAMKEDLPVCNIVFEYGDYYIYCPAN